MPLAAVILSLKGLRESCLPRARARQGRRRPGLTDTKADVVPRVPMGAQQKQEPTFNPDLRALPQTELQGKPAHEKTTTTKPKPPEVLKQEQ